MAIPAAQYLRMSTEDQQYSMTNQSLRIKEYGDKHGFDIVKTYEDPGKSGVIIKHRHGLRALLKEVVSGTAGFKAILVYDVSRWADFKIPTKRLTTSSYVQNRGFLFTTARSNSATMEPHRVPSSKH